MKRNDFYISGTRKETTFLKRGYFHFWKRLGTKKRNESKRNGNVPEPSEIWETKKSFPLSLPQGHKKSSQLEISPQGPPRGAFKSLLKF